MIVITAPTSKIGRQVLDNLLDSTEAICVVAHDPNRLPATVRQRAEIIEGSHADRNVVHRAFDGDAISSGTRATFRHRWPWTTF